MTGVREAFQKSIQALFPDVCGFCGKILPFSKNSSDSFFFDTLKICRHCLSVLPFRLPSQQTFQGIKGMVADTHFPNEPESVSFIVPFFYEGIVLSAIRRLKFQEGVFLSPALGFFMERTLFDRKISFDLIVPIPLSQKRQKERGYNQAALLAEEIGKYAEKPMSENCLFRPKMTKAQAGIEDSEKRLRNMEDAFFVSEDWDVEGARILLVDDVVTTGATFYFAAQALLGAGAKTVDCVAAASGRKGSLVGIMSMPDVPEFHVFEPS